ncbi:MAG TPA: hypothetical protein GX528_06820, partial [Firmicutes bacterium]|nr:hypothetical protein [Bacillota bacterium]
MKFTKIDKAFAGGYRFNPAGKPQDKIIDFGIPAQAVIPLTAKSGEKVPPVVEAGAEVKAGQLIGGDEKNPVRASVAGKVKGFTKLAPLEEDAVVIETDQTAGWEPLGGFKPQWQDLPAKKLQALLISAGVLGSGEKIEEIIIKGIEDTPYDLSLAVLLAEERHAEFFEGLRILRSAFPEAGIHLAVNEAREHLIARLRQNKDLPWLNLYSLSPKYPQSWREKLVPAILPGTAFDSKQVLVLPITAVFDSLAAVTQGKPVLDRLISLGGLGWQENVHLRVRLGTPVGEITRVYLKQGDYRLILNNVLVNRALTDLSLPISAGHVSLAAVPEKRKRRSFLTSFFRGVGLGAEHGEDTAVEGETMPCIFCGFCEDACPAGLLPHLLEKYVKRDIIDDNLIKYGVYDCIDCNSTGIFEGQ